VLPAARRMLLCAVGLYHQQYPPNQRNDGHAALQVTGFSNTEEEAVGLSAVVPCSLEDQLKKNGGAYSKKGDWESYAVTDGNLITGQNPQSSEAVADMVIAMLG
jgi:putative intracellular protease/amidase